MNTAGPGTVDSLLVGRGVTANQVQLSWSPSCSDGASDYAVYSGIMGTWDQHSPVTCFDAGDDFTETVGGLLIGNRYFLVVPLDPSREGSYGAASNGAERPVGNFSTCRSNQSIQACE